MHDILFENASLKVQTRMELDSYNPNQPSKAETAIAQIISFNLTKKIN